MTKPPASEPAPQPAQPGPPAQRAQPGQPGQQAQQVELGQRAAPASVRAAGAVVSLEGALGLAFAVALLVRAFGGAERVADVLGEAGYFAVLGGCVLAVGVGLLRGRRWARTPALVVQLLLLGVAWYASGPSGRPEYGVPAGLVCLAVGGALFTPRARAWAYRDRSVDA